MEQENISDNEGAQSANYKATAAAFEAVALRCTAQAEQAADVLTQLDYQSLALVAYMLAGQVAGVAVDAHQGDGQAAATHLANWATLALHEAEMQT